MVERRNVISRCIYSLPPFFRLSVILFGAVLMHLTIGTYHTFGNMLPYMASYIKNYTDSSVRIEHMMWIPTFQGCFPFAMVIGGVTTSHLGPRAAALVGSFIVTSSVYLSSITIQMSFFLFFITYGLMFGLGAGIVYVTAVTTVINWAPDKVGLVTGIVAAGFGISSSIFAPIQTMLVNPDNLRSTKDGYFVQKELLDRVPGVFVTLSVIYGVMQLIGIVLLCDPPEKEFQPATSTPRRRSKSTNSSSEESDAEEYEVFAQETPSMAPLEMLRSSTFYFLFASLFCCSFYANMFYNLYKTYGETFIEDDFFMAAAFSIGSVANAIARIAWGYMVDRTSFQITLSTATCLATVFLLTMPVTQNLGKYFYLLWLTGTFVCMGATHALYITATVKCFGSKFKATNYGYLILSTTMSGVMLSIVSQFYLSSIGYSWLFIITAAFPFTAFLVISTIYYTPEGHRVV